MWYSESQLTNKIKYSNPGYSMLGELVRVLSGKSYEEYVIDKLLVPLGLEQGVFGDPAHRVRARGVTVAGNRAAATRDAGRVAAPVERPRAGGG
jgi:CubicO group peptidase (beta-lactamase class C family)